MTVEACTVVGEGVKVGDRGAAADSVIGRGPGWWSERSVVVLAFLGQWRGTE